MSFLFARNLIFAFCLLKASCLDIEEMRIPDKLHVIMAAAWFVRCTADIVFSFVSGGWGRAFEILNFSPGASPIIRYLLWHIGAMAVYGTGVLCIAVISEKILKRTCLGGGDVKLISITALYLGFDTELYAIFTACILAGATLVFQKSESFPLGPYISIGAWLMIILSTVS